MRLRRRGSRLFRRDTIPASGGDRGRGGGRPRICSSQRQQRKGGAPGDSIIKAAPTRQGTSTPSDAGPAIKNFGVIRPRASVGSSEDAARIASSEGGLGDEEEGGLGGEGADGLSDEGEAG
jgi:hypothetical protein